MTVSESLGMWAGVRAVRSLSTLPREDLTQGGRGLGTTQKLVQRELVEERILEDGPTRTISVWREQVATNTSKERVPPIHLPVPTGTPMAKDTEGPEAMPIRQAAGIPVSTRLTDGREIINRARNMSIVQQRT
jgi:hypothetical protein